MSDRDLFISHSSRDADQARAVRSLLEQAGFSCWMAPDDVTGTDPWASQILAAIDGCRAVVVLISERSNGSSHVAREVELANARGRIVLPIRVEDVRPAGALEYHIAGLQRTDAFPPPIEKHRDLIVRRVTSSVPAQGAAVAPTVVTGGPVTTPEDRRRDTIRNAGLGAWARANSMLAGVAVTLASLFVVGAAALALNGSGSPTRSPAGPLAGASPTTAALPPTEPTPTESAPAVTEPAPTRARPAVAAGGAFPNEAEVELYMALPEYAAPQIESCDRIDSLPTNALTQIACTSIRGERVFYVNWPDVDAQRRDYLAELNSIMDNPVGSCATSPKGNSHWTRGRVVSGQVACQLFSDGPQVQLYWTDEATLVTGDWWGGDGATPEENREIGYALFRAVTGAD